MSVPPRQLVCAADHSHCRHLRPQYGTWLLMTLRTYSCSVGCDTLRMRFKMACFHATECQHRACGRAADTYRALVLHHQQHAVRLALRQLLQDMHKVDRREKVPPRVVGHELDLGALLRQRTGRVARLGGAGRGGRALAGRRLGKQGILRSTCRIGMQVVVAVLEEAARVKFVGSATRRAL